MLFKLGHIPKPGESVEFDGRRFTVAAMERNRIATVRIEKLSPDGRRCRQSKQEAASCWALIPKPPATPGPRRCCSAAARLVYLIRETLLVFVIALLFAYLLYPLMDLIDRHLTSKTRTPALAITFVLVIGILAVFGDFRSGRWSPIRPRIWPRRRRCFWSGSARIPRRARKAVRSLNSQVTGLIEAQLRQHYGDIVSQCRVLALRVLSASRNLIYLIIIPILSFLILRDGRQIRDSFSKCSTAGSEAARETLADVHELLLQYMRALLFLCCATFVSFSIVLSAMGVPYAILLAAIAFPLEFVPLVGPLTAAVIIIAVSIVTGYAHVLWLVDFPRCYRLFQDYVLSPLLMSKGVELHPLMIIFGVFAGGEIGGVAGIFLSVPVLALIRLLYHRFKKVRAPASPRRSHAVGPRRNSFRSAALNTIGRYRCSASRDCRRLHRPDRLFRRVSYAKKKTLVTAHAEPDVPQMTADQKVLHALNRLTFGPRPGDLEAVKQKGLDQWIEQQLHPARHP